MNVVVIVATVGRPQTVLRTVQLLCAQTVRPSRIIVSAASDADVADGVADLPEVTVVFGQKGLCRQRNRGLREVQDADLVIFFDDDFVPRADYVEATVKEFLDHPSTVGATGLVVADGIRGAGYSFEEAVAILARHEPEQQIVRSKVGSLYGCNMAFRLGPLRHLAFDEALPLYGWLEDVDFSTRARAFGDLVRRSDMVGVHMGQKSGRTSGLRLGYSQISNPIYVAEKGFLPFSYAFQLMRANLCSNLIRSFKPERLVDRRGRLKGNLIAIADLLGGHLKPERAERL